MSKRTVGQKIEAVLKVTCTVIAIATCVAIVTLGGYVLTGRI